MAERLREAPAVLRERVLQAVREEGENGRHAGGSAGASGPRGPQAGSHSKRLRAAAERLLRRARSGPPTRDTALTLLAADALITLAVEAEWGSDGVVSA